MKKVHRDIKLPTYKCDLMMKTDKKPKMKTLATIKMKRDKILDRMRREKIVQKRREYFKN